MHLKNVVCWHIRKHLHKPRHIINHNWLTVNVLRPTQHKIGYFKTFPTPIPWLGMEKHSLKQQKHTFTHQKKCTTTHNKHKQELTSRWDGRPWPQQTSAEKRGLLCPFHRELGSRLTQCGLEWGLLPYQVASSSIQPFGDNKHGPKIGGSAPFWGGGWVHI